MRPLVLQLSFLGTLLVITLMLSVLAPSQPTAATSGTGRSNPKPKGRFSALFSFSSPSSLFPPTAIISLTDDNSTFFLARPAAFGLLLPKNGLSGQLWIGSGFSEDIVIRGGLIAGAEGELGCDDVPGWHEGAQNDRPGAQLEERANGQVHRSSSRSGMKYSKRDRRENSKQPHSSARPNDGTDDYLNYSLSDSKSSKEMDAAKSTSRVGTKLLKEGTEISGKVVLLSRGGCGFLDKVKWAQSRGAKALIVGDNVPAGPLLTMYASGDTSDITIPSLFTSYMTAHLLASLMPSDSADNRSRSRPHRTWKPNPSKKGTDNSNAAPSRPVAQISTASPISDIPQSKSARGPGGILSAFSFKKRSSTVGPISRENLVTEPDRGFAYEQHNPSKRRQPTSRSDNRVPPGEKYKLESSSHKDLPIASSGQESSSGSDAPPSSSDRTFKSDKIADKGDTENQDADTSSSVHAADQDENPSSDDQEGLWVTLSPTSMSASPFFDTLLVLVVSPLVTLTVVYALLLLRSRIRRRRWRAPKSVVDRLPVRTYHTISDTSSASSSTLASPTSASPTTPLLQHRPLSRSNSRSRGRSRTPSPTSRQVSFRGRDRSSSPESEKREAGLAEWRRRYGGRQRECVVCLEEYEDGVSQVMSLPCGHEFHAECITPWLVTRRRTCPICKGDVVRSLARSGSSSATAHNRHQHHNHPTYRNDTDDMDLYEDEDRVQHQVAEARNDEPDASQPFLADLEAGRDNHTDDTDSNPTRTGRNISAARNRGGIGSLAAQSWAATEWVWDSLWRRASFRNRDIAVDRDR